LIFGNDVDKGGGFAAAGAPIVAIAVAGEPNACPPARPDAETSRSSDQRETDSEAINHHRRRFFCIAAMTIAATRLGRIGPARAQPNKTTNLPTVKPGTNTSFASLKQINAGVLNVGYAETGPVDGPVVVLLHGWPYDIYSYVDVAPLLASVGYRVIVPYLRGYGSTRFLSSETFRKGQLGGGCRYHRIDVCSRDKASNHRRL
jgi:hypothetical protein